MTRKMYKKGAIFQRRNLYKSKYKWRECLGRLCRELPYEQRFFKSMWVGERVCPRCKRNTFGYNQDIQEG